MSMEITLVFKKKKHRHSMKNNGQRVDPNSEQTKNSTDRAAGLRDRFHLHLTLKPKIGKLVCHEKLMVLQFLN